MSKHYARTHAVRSNSNLHIHRNDRNDNHYHVVSHAVSAVPSHVIVAPLPPPTASSSPMFVNSLSATPMSASPVTSTPPSPSCSPVVYSSAASSSSSLCY